MIQLQRKLEAGSFPNATPSRTRWTLAATMRIPAILMILVICISCKQKPVKLVDSPITLNTGHVDTPAPTQTQTTAPLRLIKYNRPIEFEKFKVDTFTSAKRHINYKSNSLAKQFRTVIEQNYSREGLNFGGHYNITIWGCGTSCQSGAVTDLKTGNVYPMPTASGGYDYKKNSRLLAVNPPYSSGYFENCSYCDPELWVWKEPKKMFQRIK
jgi:hypothetical protein